MKQITIYDLLPLLKNGWVACENSGVWYWHEREPIIQQLHWNGVKSETWNNSGELFDLSELFNIAPFDGDWKDSLIKVEHKEEELLTVLYIKEK